MTEPPISFTELYQHAGFVRRLARSLVRDEHEASDLEQLAWITAIEHPPRAGFPPRGWLAVVVHRLAARLRRSDRRREARELTAAADVPRLSDLTRDQQTRALDLVTEALAVLDDRDHQLIILRFYDGLSGQEIATRLGCPLDTVYTRLRRAVAKMRGRLDQQGRRRWHAVLAPFAAMDGAPSATTSWLGAPTVVAAGVLVATAVWIGTRPDVADAPPTTANEVARAPDPDTGPLDAEVDRAAAETVATSSASPSAATPPLIVGRVVDELRRPAPEATITVYPRGADPFDVIADAAGQFAIDRLPRRTQEVGLRAHRGEDAGVVAAPLPIAYGAWSPKRTEPVDVGVIVLSAASPARVRVGGASASTPGHVVVRAVLDDPVDDTIFLGRHRLDATGSTALPTLPAGAYRVRAVVGDWLGGQSAATLPSTTPIEVAVDRQRSVTVRAVDGDGTPIEGIQLSVREERGTPVGRYVDGLELRLLTDENGLATLTPVPRGPLRIYAGGYGFSVPMRHVGGYPLDPSSDDLRLALERLHPLRVPIDGGAPDSLRSMEVTMHPDPDVGHAVGIVGVIQDDTIELPYWPRHVAGGLAVTVDGRVSKIVVSEDGTARASAFDKAGVIRVGLTDPAGAPCANIPVRVTQAGRVTQRIEERRTDRDGVARFSGFARGKTRVAVGKDARRTVAAFDHADDDHDVLFTLPEPRSIKVVIRVDGEPRLPARFELGSTEAEVLDPREHPESGSVDVRLQPLFDTSDLSLYVRTSEYESHHLQSVPDDPDEPVVFDLEPIGAIFVDVIPPRDGRYDLALQRWHGPLGWREITASTSPSGEHGARFSSDSRGRHRVIDRLSGAVTPAVDVGAAIQRLRLDLTGVVDVPGIVRGVPGVAQSSVVVADTEGGAKDDARRVAVGGDGQFVLRLAPGRAAFVHAEHPETPNSAPVRVAGSTASVELVLVPGHRLRFSIDGLAPDGSSALEAYLSDDEADQLRRRVIAGDGGCEIRGVPTGLYRVRIVAPEHAPILLADLHVHGDVDLGPLQFPAPACLTVRLRGGVGMTVLATHRDHPDLIRFAAATDADAVTLATLAPGTWDVDARRTTSQPPIRRSIHLSAGQRGHLDMTPPDKEDR